MNEIFRTGRRRMRIWLYGGFVLYLSVFTLVGQSLPAGLTLCISTQGHVALESLVDDARHPVHCWKTESPPKTSSLIPTRHGPDTREDNCAPCVDIPLFVGNNHTAYPSWTQPTFPPGDALRTGQHLAIAGPYPDHPARSDVSISLSGPLPPDTIRTVILLH